MVLDINLRARVAALEQWIADSKVRPGAVDPDSTVLQELPGATDAIARGTLQSGYDV